MSQPIETFIVRFTSDGVAQLQKAFGDIKKASNQAATHANNATGSLGSFFGKMGGWALAATAATAAVAALGIALKETFDVGKELRTLYKTSDILGVDARVLEKWTNLAKLYDGSQSDVVGFFGGLNDMARNMREGKVSQTAMERMARLGFSEQYLYGASLPENRDKLIGDLNTLLNRKDLDAADVASLKEVFPGLNDTMISILKTSPEALQKNLEWAENQNYLSKDPAHLEESIELNKAIIELTNQLKSYLLPLLKPLVQILDAISPVIEFIGSVLGILSRLLEPIAAVAKWILNKVMGSMTMAFDALSAGYDALKNWSWKPIEDYYEKYSREGTGGLAGEILRGLDKATDKVVTGALMQNLNNTPIPALASAGVPNSLGASLAFNTPNLINGKGTLNATIDVTNAGAMLGRYATGNDGTVRNTNTGNAVGTASFATSVQ